MKVVFVSSEMVPFAKTGGLADVVGALPVALEKIGMDVACYLPKYKCVKVRTKETVIGDNVKVRFIKNKELFNRDNLYGDANGDYPDNLERFTYFCSAVLDDLKKRKEKVDIIHCHDWQTALIPVYLKSILKNDDFFADTRTVFTIHNLGYQGLFPADQFSQTGLSEDMFSIDGLEYYGGINLLKGGLLFSDILTTVSDTYSREIRNKEFGYGLDGVLRIRGENLYGICNAIDTEVWDPSTDKEIAANFSVKSYRNKAKNKKSLQKECGLAEDADTPVFGIVTRLADQKGMNLIADILQNIIEDLGAQFVLLGTGDEKYHKLLTSLKEKYKGRASFNLKFDNTLAKKIYAGSDFFLMPSKYEPCGLGQMISFRFGTAPVVRKTGGLADTVFEFNPSTGQGNGFVFEAFDSKALLSAVTRACETYKDAEKMQQLILNAMNEDFTWGRSAGEYQRIYECALSEGLAVK